MKPEPIQFQFLCLMQRKSGQRGRTSRVRTRRQVTRARPRRPSRAARIRSISTRAATRATRRAAMATATARVASGSRSCSSSSRYEDKTRPLLSPVSSLNVANRTWHTDSVECLWASTLCTRTTILSDVCALIIQM